jgi:hypothetical protein
MKFDVDNMMAALSSTKNKVYRVQQKMKQQQLTSMDVWKRVNYITLLRYCTDRDCMFNVLQ